MTSWKQSIKKDKSRRDIHQRHKNDLSPSARFHNPLCVHFRESENGTGIDKKCSRKLQAITLPKKRCRKD